MPSARFYHEAGGRAAWLRYLLDNTFVLERRVRSRRSAGRTGLQAGYPDPAKAEDSFRTALAIAREQGTRGYELRAATSLARLCAQQGRRGEAGELLAPV